MRSGVVEISYRVAVETIVKSATCAPSLHNSQPWRFVAPSDPELGNGWIDLYAARDRAAWVVEGSDRELDIACGAAIELGRVAARSLGHDATVELLPDAQDPDLLARLHVGGAYTPDDHDVRLAESIALRYTERSRFEDREITTEDLEALRSSVWQDGAWVKVLERSADQLDLYVLLDRADDIERSDPRYVEELGRWVSTDASRSDGIPPEAIDETPVDERASSLRLRDFHAGEAGASRGTPSPGEAAEAPGEDAPPPAPEHPVVAIVGTDGDDQRAWLQGGRALASLLLEGASRNIAASPMTQVLEVPAMRIELTNALGLLGHPQMVLRMGYASGHPSTPRRPLAEVLRFV